MRAVLLAVLLGALAAVGIASSGVHEDSLWEGVSVRRENDAWLVLHKWSVSVTSMLGVMQRETLQPFVLDAQDGRHKRAINALFRQAQIHSAWLGGELQLSTVVTADSQAYIRQMPNALLTMHTMTNDQAIGIEKPFLAVLHAPLNDDVSELLPPSEGWLVYRLH